MTNPMIRVHDTETDEIVDRPMTSAEFTQYQAMQAAADTAQAAVTVAANAKVSAMLKLEALGLTAAEIASLG